MIKLPLNICGGYGDSIRDADNNLVLIGVNADQKEHQDFAALVVTATNTYEANQALIKQLVEALKAADESISMSNDTIPTLDLIWDALAATKKAGF